jgi:Flp pilus assembly protein TadD
VTSAEEHLQRGIELLAENEDSLAAQAFRDALAVDPRMLEAHHGLIRALIAANDIPSAVQAANHLITLTPDDPLAHTSLSIALQHAGDIPGAEAAIARARIFEWKQQLAQPAPSSDPAQQEDDLHG